MRLRPEPTQVKHLAGAPLQGRVLASPTIIRVGWKHRDRSLLRSLWLERLARDKHSGLLRKFVNYGQKSFKTLAPARAQRLDRSGSRIDPALARPCRRRRRVALHRLARRQDRPLRTAGRPSSFVCRQEVRRCQGDQMYKKMMWSRINRIYYRRYLVVDFKLQFFIKS